MTEPHSSTATAVAGIVKEHIAPVVKSFMDHTGESREVLILPKGLEAHSLKPLMDDYRRHPERPKGEAKTFTLDAFIAWTSRQAVPESVLFANNSLTEPSLTAVINYHQPQAVHEDRAVDGDDGFAGWGDHRCTYRFPLSKAWQAWAGAEGREMAQADFARFLEDRITDVVIPPQDGRADADATLLDLVGQLGGILAGPSRLLELARGLQVTEQHRVKNAINLSTGEVQIAWETEHQGATGEQLKVPNMFLIGIPVFESEAMYRMPVRLRYRLRDGKLYWSIKRHRPELTFEHAFNEALDKVRKGLPEMPLFIGAPEG